MNNMTFRPAIAMIELIFALVIMAIVMMSAPQLMQIASNSGYVAIQQEGIGEAAARTNMVMGYYWDENDANESYDGTILTVTTIAGNSDLAKVTDKRRGTPRESYRTFIRKDGTELNATIATKLGLDLGETVGNENDIDDFSGHDINLTDFSAGSASTDYIEKTTDIKISTSVTYSDDRANYQQANIDYTPFAPTTPAGNTSNIKYITVTLTSRNAVSTPELNKTIVLHAFSCNIGSYKLEEKDF